MPAATIRLTNHPSIVWIFLPRCVLTSMCIPNDADDDDIRAQRVFFCCVSTNSLIAIWGFGEMCNCNCRILSIVRVLQTLRSALSFNSLNSIISFEEHYKNHKFFTNWRNDMHGESRCRNHNFRCNGMSALHSFMHLCAERHIFVWNWSLRGGWIWNKHKSNTLNGCWKLTFFQ